MTVWTHLLASPLDPPASAHGAMIDYLYAVNRFTGDGAMGGNAARRQLWPEDVFVYARAFTDQELDDYLRLPYGIFLVSAGAEAEYDPHDDDLLASDWLVGTRT